ncbi:GNAT family N-acetyltransferase [Curtobacterium sp. NPDC086286]|uniref:GNAT family N-acetyltransferase n=1 Tax=Curtobacterium sp. NPDC086286 TaxID=3363964 RepID=UPI003828F241
MNASAEEASIAMRTAINHTVTIRAASEPGDLGWIVQAHGEVYAAQFGWGVEFEAFVAQIVGAHGAAVNPQRETTLIAEVDDERVGSVMVAPSAEEETAQLRVLLVSPGARGLGVATRLIDEALAFALRAGYRRLTLWTSSNLTAARRRYEQAGFHLESETPALLFGTAVDEQTWALEL